MKNRKLILILSLVLALTMSLGGTLAYLTDTDGQVNVMTVGRVSIEQHEYERMPNAEGGFETGVEGTDFKADYGIDKSYKLQEFTQGKPALPAVYQEGLKWDDNGQQLWNQVGAPGSNDLFDDSVKNVIDKFVFVENTGKTDAYFRTLIAIEWPEDMSKDLLHTSFNTNSRYDGIKVTDDFTGEADKGEKSYYVGNIAINGVNYLLYNMTHNEILKPGDVARPSLLQVFLDPMATNEDVAKLGDTWEILTVSQAVQADGFAATAEKSAAQVALEAAFGQVTAETAAEWLGDILTVEEDEINTSWYSEGATEYVLNTAEDLYGFAKKVNEEGVSFSGKTVKLGADIDLANQKWEPIGQTSATQFKGTFDGQGYTISNLYVENVNETNEYYASGLFGWLVNANVKDVNINGAKVAGNAYVGVIAGYLEWEGCAITNCNVVGATVIGKHVDGTNCGDKVGVIVGFAGNVGTKVEKCTAKNCSVVAGRDAGQIAGAAKQDNIVACTATNVSVTAGGDCPEEANINEAVIGRVL